jgi:uncharacterized protein YqhQ
VVLGETLVQGMKALNFSAQQALEEEGEELGPWALALTMFAAIAAGLGLFVAAPHLISLWLGSLDGMGFDAQSLRFHLADGVIKVIFFVAYLWLISLLGEVRRVFEYHGAEHKSIYCFEEGRELSVENARSFPRLHPRCGTAFLLVVLVVSILCFALVFPLLPRLAESAWLHQLAQLGLKILLMLPIAGASYEVIKAAGKRRGKGVWGVVLWPGLQLHRLPTREPDDGQIEIALTALKAAVGAAEGEAASINVL